MKRFWWGVLAISLVATAGAYFWETQQRQEERLLPILGRVDDFTLRNQNNQPISRKDLLGKAWVADFIYTKCPDQCPMMSRKMQVIQGLVPKQAPVQLVSISVDPERDVPQELARYAEKFHYDAARWHFLTGSTEAVHALTRSFKLPVPVQQPKSLIDHSNQLVLVDARSRIRGYYDGTVEQSVGRLIKDISLLTGKRSRDPTTSAQSIGLEPFEYALRACRGGGMMSYSDLPAVNAILNSTSALLLMAGFYFIRRQRVDLHRRCMVSAFIVSAVFLVSYLTYHAHAGSRPYHGVGGMRTVYFSILISHSILAALIVPMILRTLYLALKARFIDHRRWARWTYPLWLYVSITGVVIYEMLY